MKNPPVALTLDLWALGHSGTQIAKMLGYRNQKQVQRIVEKARSINDPRAVLHETGGRVLGRGVARQAKPLPQSARERRSAPPQAIEVVPRIMKLECVRGHIRSPENIMRSNGGCRICESRRWAKVPQ